MEKDSFMKLPEERKAQILQIATEEFVRCGYAGASTNTITRRAVISKGILFHYFGSKKELYLYMLKDMVERFTAAAEKLSALNTVDYLKQRAERADLKEFERILDLVPSGPPDPGDELPQ